jgi:hypothetical protein
MKLILNTPGTEHLKLKCDDPLSNFALDYNLRRYNLWAKYRFECDCSRCAAECGVRGGVRGGGSSRGLHSFTLELNLSNSRTHS